MNGIPTAGEGSRSVSTDNRRKSSTNPSSYSVRVDHAASQQRIKIDVDGTSTLKAFQDEIAEEMNLDPSRIALFYMDDGFRVKVKGDRSFHEALTQTNMFIVEEMVSVPKEVKSAKLDPILIKVTYDSIIYAVEIKSPSLDEFNKELCKQFAWNNDDLESMHLVHKSIVVTSESFFVRALKTCSDEKVDAEFFIRPKELPPRPSMKPVIVTNAAPVAVSAKQVDSLHDHEAFDVMLSYEWTSGKEIVVRIKQELESRGLRVWFDEERMHANLYERMAEAITKSSVVSPLLTVAYTKSSNCKRELSYAGDLKKQIQPTRAVSPNEKLEPWAELVTAGLIYYDFHNALTDPIKFQKNVDGLCASIESSINKKQEAGVDGSFRKAQSEEPLVKWLQPVDFEGDVKKCKEDYVSGTRMWAAEQVTQWLNEGTNTLLWLNGGAGML
ncbi:hypothetical protein HDU76_002807 [Blyttiomyces sp. JEL0837]|nr:hypothetical protein HDU76_002807 [Blyttiomyces sp. JEL0837]